jgi:hypothetical protein
MAGRRFIEEHKISGTLTIPLRFTVHALSRADAVKECHAMLRDEEWQLDHMVDASDRPKYFKVDDNAVRVVADLIYQNTTGNRATAEAVAAKIVAYFGKRRGR